MGPKTLVTLGIILLAFVIWSGFQLGYVSIDPSKTPSGGVTNFEECVAADNPVLESYPRQCNDQEGNRFVENIGNELEKQDFIRTSAPRPNSEVQSPFVVLGEASGIWFFEATFPVELYDAQENLILETFAEAQADWMTEDFVPFEAQLVFATPQTQRGTLILKKSNPSGLVQHGDELRIPVMFNQSEDLMVVKIHALLASSIESNNCDTTVEIARNVPQTSGVARAALMELLAGLTESEKERGYTTSIPEGVEINSLTIEKGTALVDFSGELNDVAGSCTVSAIRAQIENTLKEFPIVEDVTISIDGETENILEP